jgi:O-antigen/teichoic acid export membrane protein
VDLRNKIAHGLKWTVLERIGLQALSFCIFLIVARQIGPYDYGLFSLCILISPFSYAMLLGLADGVISYHVQDDETLSSLFWVIIGAGILISFGTFLLAVPVAAFMKLPPLANMIRWTSLLPLLIAIPAVPTSIVNARMDFKIFAIRSILSTLIGGSIGIFMAIRGYGAYSLIGQQVCMQIVVAAVIWPSAHWRPQTRFDFVKLRPVLVFGMRSGVIGIIRLLGSELPRLAIGYFLGPAELGIYGFISRICGVFVDVTINSIGSVSYSALSRIRTNIGETKKLVNELFFFCAIVTFPMLTGLSILSPQLIPFLFGQKWMASIFYLNWVIAATSISPLTALIVGLLYAQQKIYLVITVRIIESTLLVTTALTLAQFGLTPFLIGADIASFAVFPVYIFSAQKTTSIDLWPEFRRLAVPLTGCVGMVATSKAIEYIFRGISNEWFILVVSMAFAVFTYIVICYIFEHKKLLSMLTGM